MENSTSFGCGGSCGILVGMKRLPLIVIAVLLVASALVVASRPAAADQNDDRLDKLFMRLLEAPVPGEAQQIEGEIWHIWMQSDDGAINGLMRDSVAALSRRDYSHAPAKFDQRVVIKIARGSARDRVGPN